MNKKGFTLMELLTVVLILGILTSIALPQYARSLERARATEAMAGIKALNDAVYAYAAARTGANACPQNFNQLSVILPPASGTNTNGSTLTTKDFIYTLNSATNAFVPGTDCPGVTAARQGGNKYDYVIWNPYRAGTAGRGAALACTSPGGKKKSKDVCDSLDLYTEGASPY